MLLIDPPSLRELQVRLEHDPIAIAGVDANCQLVYAVDVHADVTLGDYLRDQLDLEPQSSADCNRWRLRRVDVTSGVESDLGALERFPRLLALAPTGGRLIVVHEPVSSASASTQCPSDVLCIDLTSGKRRVVPHLLGRVQRCDWKPDGSAFALTGTVGGALFDAASLESTGLQSHGYGPFTPSGSAYLRRNGAGHALVELDGEGLLVGDALLPWPATRGNGRERGETEPIGLCGDRLGLYESLPTQGRHVEWSFGRGGYTRFEHAAVKVADLETGAYATILSGNASLGRPLYTSTRCLKKGADNL